ncbi:thioredoxin family protein [Streptomyces tsukubensis]|uniref:thioredoxin family protein n=1 Tax=Streptomyces tsukubensis TaxID=83656 RepID=UPI00344FF663
MSYEIVLFGAEWCRPCKTTRPLVVASCAVAGMPFEYVDIESYDSRSIDVTAVPTLRAYNEDGDVVSEHRGGMTANQVDQFIASLPM